MQAPLLQRRPDIGDRAAGLLVGMAVGEVVTEPSTTTSVVEAVVVALPAAIEHLDDARAAGTSVAHRLRAHGAEIAASSARLGEEVARLITAPPGRVRTGLESTPDDLAVVPAAATAVAVVRDVAVPRLPGRQLVVVLERLARSGAGRDVTALTGALLGARWGASAVPFDWRRAIDATAPRRTAALQRRAMAMVDGGGGLCEDWPLVPMLGSDRHEQSPAVAELPGDAGVLIGNLPAVHEQVDRVEAVVSLCRVEAGLVPDHIDHHEVLLVDRADPAANPNLELVLADTAAAVATLRGEGRRVLLHCHAGRSRAPTVAAAHLAQRDGCSGSDAFARIAARLPHPDPHNHAFQRALAGLPPAADAVDATGLR